MNGSVIAAWEVTALYRPGSGEWSWAKEFADLIGSDPQGIADLVLDVAANGVREPILLGDDGRVWDGHHRILAAAITGAHLFAEHGHTKAVRP